jgi:diaminohydroxyphosphoribosylaminopyrimidine deaminase/5-amino-6-(5-phosphoribosylamino)uracil reductase
MDLKFLDLAAEAAATIDPHQTTPNPRVGCVVVKDKTVIATGVHAFFGAAHAEVNALQGFSKNDVEQSRVYITLEPCVSHTDKKTPACTDLLIKLKPQAVIIGHLDPHFPGQGVAKLRAAGINVTVLETNHHPDLNPWFKTWMVQKKPFITLKVAQSLDGKITPSLTKYQKGERALTGAQTQTVVHSLRAHHQALLTSTQTILEDDPLLDVRHAEGLSFTPSAPDIIIAGTRDIPKNARVFSVPNRQVHFISDLEALVPYCQKHKIASVMTECGGQLNTQLLAADLVNQIEIFTAPIFCGGTAKPSFVQANDLSNFTLANSHQHGHDMQLSLHRTT